MAMKGTKKKPDEKVYKASQEGYYRADDVAEIIDVNRRSKEVKTYYMIPKRSITAGLLICFAILSIVTISSYKKEYSNDICGTASIMLSDAEKEFLVFNCVDEEATKEQIEKGKLPEWKRDLIYRYRQAMEYLAAAYPERKFTITTYENITDYLIKFFAMEDIDENAVFTIIINKESGLITDTYDE